MRTPLILLAATLLLAGCAGLETRGAQETELILGEAGFAFKMADTPAKRAHLQTLPQRTMFQSRRHGRLYYLYADAQGCQCLFVGTEADYQRYRERAWQHYVYTGQERLEYLEGDRNSSGGWNDWGPW